MSDNETFGCEWVLDRIEGYLDGADGGLGEHERAALEQHVATCARCASEMARARRTLESLRELPTHSVPERVVSAAEAAIRRAGTQREAVVPMERFRERPRRSRPLRWAPALAAAMLLVSALLWWRERQTGVETAATEPTPAEIQSAARDAALALAYVGKYTRRTGDLIRDDVIGLHVVLPLRDALATSREEVVDETLVPTMKRAMKEAGLGETKSPDERS